jgi:hypothetical protein
VVVTCRSCVLRVEKPTACSGVLVYVWRVVDGGDLGMIVVRWLVGRITHGRTKKLHGYTDTVRMDTQHTRDDEQYML